MGAKISPKASCHRLGFERLGGQGASRRDSMTWGDTVTPQQNELVVWGNLKVSTLGSHLLFTQTLCN